MNEWKKGTAATNCSILHEFNGKGNECKVVIYKRHKTTGVSENLSAITASANSKAIYGLLACEPLFCS